MTIAFSNAELIDEIHARFVELGWHDESAWQDIESRLSAADLSSVAWMEESGGEPAIAPWWKVGAPLILCDSSTESPAGRRSLCYDQPAWDSRKKNKPAGNAVSIAQEHGANLMTESEYLQLQERGEFDTKTSNWLRTPDDIRDKGGALFGDRRFGRAFIYCNGAESYYAVRGFRVTTCIT